jgi:peptidoglycan/LPS O-acetylase OafA/YrhL
MTTITAPTTAKDSFLRFAMRLDAVITGIGGVAGLAIAPWLAKVSGTTPAFEYSMGVFFVVYGVAVFALARKRHVRVPGMAAVAGNLVYTALAVLVVLAGTWPLTTMGIVATLGSGVFTLVMADLQYLGLRRMRA